MARYTAWVTDPDSPNEGVYAFESREDLFDDTPMRIVRAFMEDVDENLFPAHHLDYEIYAALKHGDHKVVTAMGSFLSKSGPSLPFTLFISAKPHRG
jgi:hypothetical protein